MIQDLVKMSMHNNGHSTCSVSSLVLSHLTERGGQNELWKRNSPSPHTHTHMNTHATHTHTQHTHLCASLWWTVMCPLLQQWRHQCLVWWRCSQRLRQQALETGPPVFDEAWNSSAVTISAQQGQCDCKGVTHCVLLCTAIADYAKKCVDTGVGRCEG